jgi:hypothetical protein
VRLPPTSLNEERYQIQCVGTIESCRDKSLEVCAGSYTTVETTGSVVEPKRVTTAPGPSTTGPRYRRLKWVGKMVIACGQPPPRADVAEQVDAHSATPAPATAPSTPKNVCTPGATQACLGPGACRGAQACTSDGRGYGVCDCGSLTPDPRLVRPIEGSADAGPPTTTD